MTDLLKSMMDSSGRKWEPKYSFNFDSVRKNIQNEALLQDFSEKLDAVEGYDSLKEAINGCLEFYSLYDPWDIPEDEEEKELSRVMFEIQKALVYQFLNNDLLKTVKRGLKPLKVTVIPEFKVTLYRK